MVVIIRIMAFCIALYFILEFSDRFRKKFNRDLKRIQRMDQLDKMVDKYFEKD